MRPGPGHHQHADDQQGEVGGRVRDRHRQSERRVAPGAHDGAQGGGPRDQADRAGDHQAVEGHPPAADAGEVRGEDRERDDGRDREAQEADVGDSDGGDVDAEHELVPVPDQLPEPPGQGRHGQCAPGEPEAARRRGGGQPAVDGGQERDRGLAEVGERGVHGAGAVEGDRPEQQGSGEDPDHPSGPVEPSRCHVPHQPCPVAVSPAVRAALPRTYRRAIRDAGQPGWFGPVVTHISPIGPSRRPIGR